MAQHVARACILWRSGVGRSDIECEYSVEFDGSQTPRSRGDLVAGRARAPHSSHFP